MLIKWIYQVSMVLMLHSIFFLISLFCGEDNSRMNPLNERTNDTIQATPTDSLEVLIGSVTRLRAKRFKRF